MGWENAIKWEESVYAKYDNRTARAYLFSHSEPFYGRVPSLTDTPTELESNVSSIGAILFSYYPYFYGDELGEKGAFLEGGMGCKF